MQDPDLREYTRDTLLTAIAQRSSPQSSASKQKKLTSDKLNAEPLFTPDEDDDIQPLEVFSDDEGLAMAIQASYDNQPRVPAKNSFLLANADDASLGSNLSLYPDPGEDDDDDDLYTFPTADLATQNAEVDRQSSLPLYSSNSSSRVSVGDTSVSMLPRSVSPIARPSPAIGDIPSSNGRVEAGHLTHESPAANDLDLLSTGVSSSVSSQKQQSTSSIATSPKSAGPTTPRRPYPLPTMQQTNIMLEDPDVSDQSSHSDENSASDIQHNEQAKSPLQTLESLDANGEASQFDITEDWDPAHEIDPHAEEGEFARFMSKVKGKGIAEVRRELDDEIATLHQQRKAAMRDSEDITQQMVAQIMVRISVANCAPPC
jgi:DNA excision repair protein ERCC-5